MLGWDVIFSVAVSFVNLFIVKLDDICLFVVDVKRSVVFLYFSLRFFSLLKTLGHV